MVWAARANTAPVETALLRAAAHERNWTVVSLCVDHVSCRKQNVWRLAGASERREREERERRKRERGKREERGACPTTKIVCTSIVGFGRREIGYRDSSIAIRKVSCARAS